MNWQRDVARSLSDQSEVSHRPKRSTRRQVQAAAPTVVITQPMPSRFQVTAVDSTMASSKALIGTLIGAAAGATIAYAMTKAEAQDDAAAAARVSTTYQVRASPHYTTTSTRPSSRRCSVSYRPQPTSGSPHVEEIPTVSAKTLANTITHIISAMEISPSAPVPSRSTVCSQPPAIPYTISEPSTADGSKTQPSRSSHGQHRSTYESPSRASTKKSKSERVATISISNRLDRGMTVDDDDKTIIRRRRGQSRTSHRSRRDDDHLMPSDSISQVSSSHRSGSRQQGRNEGGGSRTSTRYEAIEW
jgi:hypothetical protein